MEKRILYRTLVLYKDYENKEVSELIQCCMAVILTEDINSKLYMIRIKN